MRQQNQLSKKLTKPDSRARWYTHPGLYTHKDENENGDPQSYDQVNKHRGCAWSQ